MEHNTIPSSLAGTGLREHRALVTWRDTTNYAAGIGDTNGLYFNDESADGLIAHPVFPTALTWPIIEHLEQYVPDPDFPLELLRKQVHYTEHLVLHRPIRPGAALTISGKIHAVQPHRAGSVCVLRFDALDDGGVPLFTEFIGGMLRGSSCEGARASEYAPPGRIDIEKSRGMFKETHIPVPHLLPYIYDGCSRIHFPIHTSPAFAHMVGLPGIIVQGTAVLALAVSALVDSELGGNAAMVREIACLFTGMVFPGDTVTLRLIERRQIQEDIELNFDVMGKNGKKALSSGYLRSGMNF